VGDRSTAPAGGRSKFECILFAIVEGEGEFVTLVADLTGPRQVSKKSERGDSKTVAENCGNSGNNIVFSSWIGQCG
jgi:hypothetical protein